MVRKSLAPPSRCDGVRDETASDGSFCLCRNGSPPGHAVPATMLMLSPAIGIWAWPTADVIRRIASSVAVRWAVFHAEAYE